MQLTDVNNLNSFGPKLVICQINSMLSLILFLGGNMLQWKEQQTRNNETWVLIQSLLLLPCSVLQISEALFSPVKVGVITSWQLTMSDGCKCINCNAVCEIEKLKMPKVLCKMQNILYIYLLMNGWVAIHLYEHRLEKQKGQSIFHVFYTKLVIANILMKR